jgi:hypothetical protein
VPAGTSKFRSNWRCHLDFGVQENFAGTQIIGPTTPAFLPIRAFSNHEPGPREDSKTLRIVRRVVIVSILSIVGNIH